MLVVIPIRTESAVRRTPHVNYALIGINIAVFMLLNERLPLPALATFKDRYLAFHADQPALLQFLTYQFLHADTMHVLANMLFLWVFGNSVNAKMGDLPYLLFYLAGGVFAAWGFAAVSPGPTQLVGASGAIASVTTAYLVLHPRSRVTVLVWLFIFIHFFELPAMVIIVAKIIVWDNIVSPGLSGAGNVAHSAHLAGYFFGFTAAMGMLLMRALPRDQFDILALWSRWRRRREFAAVMASPNASARAQFGSAARLPSVDPQKRAEEDRRFDQLADLRSRIGEQLEGRDMQGAALSYEQLLDVDDAQCLSLRHQMEIARGYYTGGRFEQAAAAFERFLAHYGDSAEAADVRLLLGIIYARDLRRYESADEHLTGCLTTLRDDARRDQCRQWLANVRAALGRPACDT